MDTSPIAMFDNYDQDFQQIITSIGKKLGEKSEAEDVEQRKTALRRVEMELDEADELVSQMEIEVQGMPQSIKFQYQAKIKKAKQDLTQFKKLSKERHAQLARSDLLGGMGGRPIGPSSSDDPYGTSDRTRLLAGTSLLEDGTRRLQESQRIALETEEQGTDILSNLRRQREQIENSRDTLYTADSSIDRASGTLKKMIRQMYKQRVITGAIIAVLVLIILIIVYEKVFA